MLPLPLRGTPHPPPGLLLPPGPFQSPFSNTFSSPLGFCPAALNKAHPGWCPTCLTVCPPTYFHLCRHLGTFCCLHGLNVITHLCVSHLCFPCISISLLSLFSLSFRDRHLHCPRVPGRRLSCEERRGLAPAGHGRFRPVPAGSGSSSPGHSPAPQPRQRHLRESGEQSEWRPAARSEEKKCEKKPCETRRERRRRRRNFRPGAEAWAGQVHLTGRGRGGDGGRDPAPGAVPGQTSTQLH